MPLLLLIPPHPTLQCQPVDLQHDWAAEAAAAEAGVAAHEASGTPQERRAAAALERVRATVERSGPVTNGEMIMALWEAQAAREGSPQCAIS